MIKPGRYDFPCSVLITGLELKELKKHIYILCESYGLDSRLDKYKGKRPIQLYRWDMEWIIETLEDVLASADDYPDHNSPGYITLKKLKERLTKIYKKEYKRFL